MAFPRPIRLYACDRARRWLSLELDDELSPLEVAALRAHLADCADCRAFEANVRAIAGELRAAPLVEPAPFELPSRRRRPHRAYLAAGAAAAVAAAVGFGSLVGTLTRSGNPSAPHGSRTAIAATQQPYVEQSLLAMLRHLHPSTGRTVAL